MLLGIIYFQHIQEDEDLINLPERGRRLRATGRKRTWIRQWLDVGRRFHYGHYHRLIPEFRNEDPASFLNFLRLPPAMFDDLHARLRRLITKQDTNYRKAIKPGLKLVMTIRHLATGDRYVSKKFDFRPPHNRISLCVQFSQNLVKDGTCLMRGGA